MASILQAADTYRVMHLRQHCISFMVDNFADVVRTDGFGELISESHRPLVLLLLEEVSSRMPKPLPLGEESLASSTSN